MRLLPSAGWGLVAGATCAILGVGCASAVPDDAGSLDSVSISASSCPTWPPGEPDSAFCSVDCPCDQGQGDCDSDSQCLPGLNCEDNVGADYGMPAKYDVCVRDCPSWPPDAPDSSFCSAECPCGHGQGDCDSDSECQSGHFCVLDVGADYGMPAKYDVCVQDCPSWPPGAPDSSFCSAACPCAEGQGDCDGDAECDTGLRCTTNVGASYELPVKYDVCVPEPCQHFDASNPKSDFCSLNCPCWSGQGDCDTNGECAPDLFCGADEGASFGLPAKYDVCLHHYPGVVMDSIIANWTCNIPECSGSDWVGAVIDWPSWAAYNHNARSGDSSRTVYDEDGNLLYPYMGPWANGCEVTAESGLVLIIEWERGANVWRETWLNPGESHTIALVPPENNAMIETYDFSPGFSVSLQNCQPQPL